MPLIKGAKRVFDWLRIQKAGTSIDRNDFLQITKWKDSALKTYLNKRKLEPFVKELLNGDIQTLMNGKDVEERYFNEVFTQTSPKTISLCANDIVQGQTDQYRLIESLGNGAVGQVWSAKTKSNGTLVAVKVMLPRLDLLGASHLPNVRQRFKREAQNGLTIKHSQIITYLDHGELQGNPFLVMELADSSVGKLLKDEGPLPEEDVCQIVADCVDALEYLHSSGSFHRDVKPDNILTFQETYKLGNLGIVQWSDFDPGFVSAGSITRASLQLGSWHYMAPEQQMNPHEVTAKSDIFALGVSWIHMLSGEVPNPHAIGAKGYPPPSASVDINNLIARMVGYHASDRPLLEEIKLTISIQ